MQKRGNVCEWKPYGRDAAYECICRSNGANLCPQGLPESAKGAEGEGPTNPSPITDKNTGSPDSDTDTSAGATGGVEDTGYPSLTDFPGGGGFECRRRDLSKIC